MPEDPQAYAMRIARQTRDTLIAVGASDPGDAEAIRLRFPIPLMHDYMTSTPRCSIAGSWTFPMPRARRQAWRAPAGSADSGRGYCLICRTSVAIASMVATTAAASARLHRGSLMTRQAAFNLSTSDGSISPRSIADLAPRLRAGCWQAMFVACRSFSPSWRRYVTGGQGGRTPALREHRVDLGSSRDSQRARRCTR